ncbi:MAG: pyridoxal phosphate-dependent aminotransferase family protein [Bacteroidota bacterium]
MAKFPEKLAKKIRGRSLENSLRALTAQENLIDFASNDYLGFARDATLQQHVNTFLENDPFFKSGATGSRLLSGNHYLYPKLEQFLARYHGYEEAIVFNSGYDANVGLLSSVPQRGDIVFYDELVHASTRDGIRMGNAKAYKYLHNDLEDLQKRIQRIKKNSEQGDIYVVTESVFSMDGDSPDISKLAHFCNQYNLYLIIDEAHAVGVFGRGVVHQYKVQPFIFASVVTFGKALGCHGAAILGNASLKKYLTNFANSLVYTTGLPPHTLATILMSYEYLQSPGGMRAQEQLLANIDYFNSRIAQLKLREMFLTSNSAIQIAILPGIDRVKACAQRLRESGIDAKPILAPTVVVGKERLRICLHAYNLHSDIDKILNVISDFKDG